MLSRRLALPIAASLALAIPAAAPASSLTPGSAHPHTALDFRVRAPFAAGVSDYEVVVAGPRAGCPGTHELAMTDAAAVAHHQALHFVLTPPRRGWCRGVHHAVLLLSASEEVEDDACDEPESGSSQCEPYTRSFTRTIKRFTFRIS